MSKPTLEPVKCFRPPWFNRKHLQKKSLLRMLEPKLLQSAEEITAKMKRSRLPQAHSQARGILKPTKELRPALQYQCCQAITVANPTISVLGPFEHRYSMEVVTGAASWCHLDSLIESFGTKVPLSWCHFFTVQDRRWNDCGLYF